MTHALHRHQQAPEPRRGTLTPSHLIAYGAICQILKSLRGKQVIIKCYDQQDGQVRTFDACRVIDSII